MKHEKRDHELIDRHLRGQLSRDEAAEFDRRRADPAFASRLEETETALEAVRYDGDRQLKTMLRAEEERLRQQQRPQALLRSLPVRRGNKWMGIAATVLILLALGLWWTYTGPTVGEPDYLAAYFEPFPNRAVNITKSATTASRRERAYAAYQIGDYETVIADLTLVLRDSTVAVDRFYLANAYLASGQPEQALPLLEGLTTDTGFPLSAQSRWYQALALLELGQMDEARELLRVIGADSRAFQREKAEELLRKIP